MTCNGDCDGSIVLDLAGWHQSFTYLWTPTFPRTVPRTPLATGLCAGDWTATVTDGVGCDTTLHGRRWTSGLDLVVDSGGRQFCSTAGRRDRERQWRIARLYDPLDGSWLQWPGDITGLIPGTYVLVVADANLFRQPGGDGLRRCDRRGRCRS